MLDIRINYCYKMLFLMKNRYMMVYILNAFLAFWFYIPPLNFLLSLEVHKFR